MKHFLTTCTLVTLSACHHATTESNTSSGVTTSAATASIALFNGEDLAGWHTDIPDADDNTE